MCLTWLGFIFIALRPPRGEPKFDLLAGRSSIQMAFCLVLLSSLLAVHLAKLLGVGLEVEKCPYQTISVSFGRVL